MKLSFTTFAILSLFGASLFATICPGKEKRSEFCPGKEKRTLDCPSDGK
ncbi:MAG: hypothetical protein SH817_07420 [Leptospira sp.]|nr:hypothetical protein [Leptospira sp.]